MSLSLKQLSAVAVLSISCQTQQTMILAQTVALDSGPSDPHTVELVREAVASLSEQATARRRFTFFELAHTQNRTSKGKLFYDRTTLIETTYIANLPFERVVEIDGKPLSRKALAAEQARYDQAVHDRAALDAEARARIDKQAFVNATLPFSQLTTRFRLIDLREETLQTAAGERLTHVIDALPLASTNPALPMQSRHIRLWIGLAGSDAATGPTPYVLRTEFDYLTPDQSGGGEIQPGSHGSGTFVVIDGVAVPEHKEIHSKVSPNGQGSSDKFIQVDVEQTYSRYRQFTSEIHMLPVTPP